jgi:hypothetical protein
VLAKVSVLLVPQPATKHSCHCNVAYIEYVLVLQGALVDALLPLCPDPSTLTAATSSSSSSSAATTATALLAPSTTSGRPPSGPNASGSSQGQSLTWSKLRALGAGLWLTEPGALRSTAEALARAQYAATKDPHDCALLYLALGKKQLVQGLFKSAGNKKVRGMGTAGHLLTVLALDPCTSGYAPLCWLQASGTRIVYQSACVPRCPMFPPSPPPRILKHCDTMDGVRVPDTL